MMRADVLSFLRAASKAAALAWLATGCMDDRIAGGGTETGNADVVAGRILDSDGRGLARMRVNLEEVRTAADGSDGGASLYAFTDEKGNYAFKKVASGRYALYAPSADDADLAAISTRLEKKDVKLEPADAISRRSVTLVGRVIPSPASGNVEDIKVCVPGMRACVSPGADSVWTLPSAPKGTYEILFRFPHSAQYLAVQVGAESGTTVYVRDAALGDSADATHQPYSFYELPEAEHSFSIVPRAYAAGEEPAWYAGKSFADVKYYLLSETGASTLWNPDYLAGWKYSRTLDGDSLHTGADLPQPLAGFPALVRLSAANFDFAQARADGGDLAFSDTAGHLLPFEIERWDAAGKRAEVWVRMDAMAAAKKDRKVVMHWGNPSATPRSDGAGVFRASEGFIGAWHFLETSGAEVAEARGLFSGALTGPAPAGGYSALRNPAGAIGPALALGKTGDYAHFPNQAALDVTQTFTVSIWARLDAGAPARKQLMASKWQPNKREWHFAIQVDRTFEMEFGDTAGVIQGNWRSKTPVATPEQWHLYGCVFDKGTVKLYQDGVEVSGAVNTGTIPTAVTRFKSDVNIGSNTIDTTLNLQGGLDEFQYYSTAKPKEWMDMLFRTQKPQP
jgi:hypothetical protein